MQRYRLKEEFSYYTEPVHKMWIIEEKLWHGWVNVYRGSSYYRSDGSYVYEEARDKLNKLVRGAEFVETNRVRAKAFKPAILYPPVPDKEPS